MVRLVRCTFEGIPIVIDPATPAGQRVTDRGGCQSALDEGFTSLKADEAVRIVRCQSVRLLA